MHPINYSTGEGGSGSPGRGPAGGVSGLCVFPAGRRGSRLADTRFSFCLFVLLLVVLTFYFVFVIVSLNVAREPTPSLTAPIMVLCKCFNCFFKL